ncbi:MAG TPA: BadF/BadG/BcrA/BcrD ATPase family protein [Candidatus Dormibacteraeota bacterium]|nr:BadF/BadG/BcrA/BcrD ATPase family protein [Candidatus Dormibacteraeota bacterium]
MPCVLGFDGGGTKTDCVAMDRAGNIIARSRSGPSNPMCVGVEASVSALRHAAQSAVGEFHAISSSRTLQDPLQNTDDRAVLAICAGLAGTGNKDSADTVRRGLVAAFPGIPVKICTDLEIALAAVPETPAIVLIAGTGSAAMGRDNSGRIERAGGHGPKIGDEGSAYDIGQSAIRAAKRDSEQTGQHSNLAKQILHHAGCADWSQWKERPRPAPGELFPQLFPIVAATADAGDETAQAILRRATEQLAALVAILVGNLALRGVPFYLAKFGGMIGRSSFFDSHLDLRLLEVAPRATIGFLPISPAEAAARLALQLISRPEETGN